MSTRRTRSFLLVRLAVLAVGGCVLVLLLPQGAGAAKPVMGGASTGPVSR